jgi:hypothetical protein
MLDEITEIFTNATVFEREEIYNKIKNRLWSTNTQKYIGF